MREHYEFHLDEERPGKVRRILKKTAVIGVSAALIGTMTFGGMSVLGAESKKVSLKTADLTALNSDSDYVDTADIVEEVIPSVVSISTRSVKEVEDYYSYFGFGGYGPIEQEVEGGGSGIIVGSNDTELLVATNAHVIAGAQTITVTFADNESVEGTVKGYDEDKDVAIVYIPLDNIKTSTLESISIANIGSSDDARVGERVMIIGNAMAYGISATTGIISSKSKYMAGNDVNEGYFQLGTDDKNDGRYVNLLQTDAAINPGASGGALVNMKGEVIGIAEGKTSYNDMVEGMCYAIAISDVAEVLEDIMSEETRETLDDDEHGILGISGMTITEEDALRFGFPKGVYIAEVAEDGAADEAGLKANMIITEFNGHAVKSIEALIERVNTYKPGEEVDITYVYMHDGEYEEKTVTVTLGEQTEEYKAGRVSTDDEDDRTPDFDEKDRKNPKEDKSRDADEDFDLDDSDDEDEDQDEEDEDSEDEESDDEDEEDEKDSKDKDDYGDSEDGKTREEIMEGWNN